MNYWNRPTSILKLKCACNPGGTTGRTHHLPFPIGLAATVILLHVFTLSPRALHAEDYQYQYFHEENKYTPFSDYIPKSRLHFKTVPHYLEDYYLLYSMKQYYNEGSLRRIIERLKTALNSKFRHPSQALVKIESEAEYLKYRNLMFMHINMLIMRDQLKIAARYDTRKLYFYNLDFAEDIRKSLDTAAEYYREALPYWQEARKYALKASEIKITTDLGTIESERYSIINGNTDFGKTIETYLQRIEKKKIVLDNAIARNK